MRNDDGTTISKTIRSSQLGDCRIEPTTQQINAVLPRPNGRAGSRTYGSHLAHVIQPTDRSYRRNVCCFPILCNAIHGSRGYTVPPQTHNEPRRLVSAWLQALFSRRPPDHEFRRTIKDTAHIARNMRAYYDGNRRITHFQLGELFACLSHMRAICAVSFIVLRNS